MAEQFKDAGPCSVSRDMKVETDEETYPDEVGKLWTGSTWLTVPEAREFRAWLDKVIP